MEAGKKPIQDSSITDRSFAVQYLSKSQRKRIKKRTGYQEEVEELWKKE